MKEFRSIYNGFLRVRYRYWQTVADFGIGIARALGNHQKKSLPIFLVGCGRSGTSMVLRGLGKSYKVEIYNESNPVAFTKFRLKDFATIEKLNASGYALFKLYKPILDTHMSVKYLSKFPLAKIIFVYRHYSDVISSSIRYFGADNWPSRVAHWIQNDFDEFASAPPPADTKAYIRSLWTNKLSAESSIALYWLFYNRLYIDLGLNRNSRVILINYENVVTKPEVEFRRLCKFLNIGYSQKMVEDMFITSIKHIQLPELEKTIQNECDKLWDYLCGQAF